MEMHDAYLDKSHFLTYNPKHVFLETFSEPPAGDAGFCIDGHADIWLDDVSHVGKTAELAFVFATIRNSFEFFLCVCFQLFRVRSCHKFGHFNGGFVTGSKQARAFHRFRFGPQFAGGGVFDVSRLACWGKQG